MSTRKTTFFYAVLIAIASVAIGMVIASRLDLAPASTAQSLGVAPTANSSPITGAIDATTFRNIAREVSPAVVNIRTESNPRTEELTEFFGGEDLFRRFFGEPPAQRRRAPRQTVGAGTGFVIDIEEGLILTNNHVVENTTKIEVGFFGDESDMTYEAKIVGRDPLTDSALIQLARRPSQGLTEVKFGDSDQIEPGDWVLAIGNPFNLNHTVTVGVVSALGRPFQVTRGRTVEMLQTDAAINPGNSGGPLLNIRGEVVGINTAILSDRGAASNMGIGFAVPINAVRELIPELRAGRVTRGMIGVEIQPVDAQALEDYGLTTREGAEIRSVTEGGPAAKAGIRPGDVLVEFNGRRIANSAELPALVTRTKPGSTVPVKVIRDRKPVSLNVTVGELNLEAEAGTAEQESSATESTGFGIALEDITADVARRLRLPRATQGALVADVEPGSPAANGGMLRFDVITQVNGEDVASAADAQRKLQAIPSGRLARMLVLRSGQEVFLSIRKD